MLYQRKNVWKLGGDWANAILWYARGVAAMKRRPITEPTSWRFYGAIHGIDPGLWQRLGYLNPTEPMPNQLAQNTFWNQCQHGSWYFLPWHRGYLLAFEANVRAEVIKLGGPAEWALPYWNYFIMGEANLPPAFASPNWPDGQGDNPLFVQQRYGPDNDGTVYIPQNEVNLDAMNDPAFTGVASGGSPGFGGVDTGFDHGGQVHGDLESQPHDQVHVLIGGGDLHKPSLMADPDTAGLDPIFWLHHANIDRLWAAWRQSSQTHVDPPNANWVQGPGSIGDRVFAMPMPDGTTWNYTPGDMTDPARLDYEYDDLSPATTAVAPGERLLRLGMNTNSVRAIIGAPIVESANNVELIGANRESVRIQGSEAHISVHFDDSGRRKVVASLNLVAQPIAPTPVPDRIFLNLENVRGVSDSTAFQVYVGLPHDANPTDHPELLAGGIALFGVRKASLADGEHGGQGLTFVLEITNIIDSLHLSNNLDINAIDVRIVPRRPVSEDDQVSIGRISIFRQGN